MADDAAALSRRYAQVRARSERLCAPLAPEDHVPQPAIDVSPPKWHLAHVTWFFETLILTPHLPGYRVFDARYAFLFNSYYESLGPRVARARRGDLSRPTVAQILDYRAHVDAAMHRLLEKPLTSAVAELIELGLHHEQQHQELLVTDIKYIFGHNPLAPPYDPDARGELNVAREHQAEAEALAPQWLDCAGGTVVIGHDGADFAFDNERPRHRVHVPAMQLRTALVTNAEYLAFVDDGGYQRFDLWHSEAWDWLATLTLRAPLYWQRDGGHSGRWLHYTLTGLEPLPLAAPVTHISWYEACAFCAWAGWRLPTEFEWEALAARCDWGRRWEWTASAYAPYPGFRAAPGASGEYNGKFMVNQQVLRGASFATPPGHARATYRNFFHPPLRWQYTGIRPARERAA